MVSTGLQLRKAEEVFDDCPDLVEIITMSEMRGNHPDYVRSWDDVIAEGAAYWEEHSAKLERN